MTLGLRGKVPRCRPQAGMTLIEILVTLLLVSVGLLGVAALQVLTLKGNQEAYVRSQASMLSGYILDRMRANPQGFLSNEYDNIDFDETGDAAKTSGADLARWQADINRLLPGGADMAAGSITRGAGNIVTVTIRWGERADRVLDTDAGAATFVTRTEI